MARYVFDGKRAFLDRLEELVKSGVPKKKIKTYTPYPVHEMEHLLDDSQSPVRYFTAMGAVSGLVAGFAFTIFTVLDWPSPMITGGKPYVSVPAFLIIAYEMTILFGCLTAFVGFLYLARVPVFQNLFAGKEEFTKRFEIEVDE